MVKRSILIGSVFLLFGILLVGCSKTEPAVRESSDKNINRLESGGGQGPKEAVAIVNMAFDPQEKDVPEGATIVWTNNDSTSHQVHADDGSFSSEILNKGDSFEVQIGMRSITYHCHIHSNMKGKLNVI